MEPTDRSAKRRENRKARQENMLKLLDSNKCIDDSPLQELIGKQLADFIVNHRDYVKVPLLTIEECNSLINYYEKYCKGIKEQIIFTEKDKRWQTTISESSVIKDASDTRISINDNKKNKNNNNQYHEINTIAIKKPNYQIKYHKTPSNQTLHKIREMVTSICNPIYKVHPQTCGIEFKILESKGVNVRQDAHSDNKFYTEERDPTKRGAEHTPFSCLIALENEKSPTSLITFKRLGGTLPLDYTVVEDQTIKLDQGEMLIFRGDLPHAGAAYKKRNRRAFMGVSTYRFPQNAAVARFNEHVPPKKRQRQSSSKEEGMSQK